MGDFPLEEEHQQYQLPFEDLPSVSQQNRSPKSKKRRKTPARTLEAPVFRNSSSSEEKQEQLIEGIPEPTLPTRWEGLQDKIGSNTASLLTIIRPIPEAMKVVDDIVRYI